MKKIISFVIFALLILWLSYGWRAFQHQQISERFAQQVTLLVEQMQVYDMLDLQFLPDDISQIDIETKKKPTQYMVQLQQQFQSALQTHNATYGIWSQQWFPVQLDSSSLLQSLSLEQKVAQLFLFGFDGTQLDDSVEQWLTAYQPGGIILMGKNISPQLSTLINDLQSTQQDLPLFVSIDQEWGLVARLDETLPSQSQVQLDEICDVYTTRSDALHAQGINMNFGIVADITSDPESFIFPRVFGGDITEVSDKVVKAADCTSTTLSTLKHWPWHGGTALDTHQGIARLIKPKSSREQADLRPFVSGIWAEADLVMMWHLIADFVDPTLPATLSRSHHAFLRSLGFDGLTVTDDMLMISSNGPRQQQLEQALIAGNDLILYVDPDTIWITKILDLAIQLVRDGLIAQTDLDARLSRIIEKKQKILSWDRFVPLELLTTQKSPAP